MSRSGGRSLDPICIYFEVVNKPQNVGKWAKCKKWNLLIGIIGIIILPI
jgi:hypothetical protein